MSSTIRVAADHRTLRLIDAAVLFWVVLWVAIGAWTGVTLWRAADVGDTVASSGRSLVSVGEGLQSLSAVPLVGDRPAEIGADVVETADEISARGGEVKGQLRQLGVVLGIAVVGIPVTPIAGLYVPLRLRRGREVARIRRHLADHADDPRYDRYLADRARASLPYDTVATLDPSPDGGPDGGPAQRTPRETHRLLADAELARLGIRRPAPARR
ncbi:hypothetical protein [Nocardioides sp. AX2bis]|uniref:hypothetical protein n=1 Tax=Nocardioides sp. AX2bis TaxID=2653157 RepID=UPI0012F3760E|nr:hypothetical protein [Nocardioides sp. AX2bis]VXC58743.1 conserved hypothetical protein [Nocardioides sp. AX2bis]